MATAERRLSSGSDSSSGASEAAFSHPEISEGTAPTNIQSDQQVDVSRHLLGASASSSMDRFLQKMRSDLMFELRGLQHGQRPVTGQSHRENLQQFMEKHIVGHMPSAAAAGGKEINVANVDSVDKHRPEAVVIEVQGIIEQRPVSSILQSAAFRRQLENVIRGSLTSVRRQTDRGSSSPSRPSQASQAISSGNNGIATRSAQSSPVPAPRRTVGTRPQLARSESRESVESFSSARSSLEQDLDSDIDDEETRASLPVVPPQSTSPQSGGLTSSQPEPQPRQRNSTPQRELSAERIAWSDISRIQRDELVEEISELLHSRLVSSTLDGEFRASLELNMQERLSASGANGQAVRDHIRNLPPSGVQHNDFSHLGINPLPENDNLDNISVTGVSVHSVPYVQTNTYLGREIQSLRSQMNEMKNMLKLTFDLQMDIQRAIRQEVAAAMSCVVAQGATAGITASPPAPTRPVSDTHCLICLERHTDTVLYQCGHMCVCYVCGRDLVSRGHNCPVCRAPIKDVIRAFKTNAE